MVFGALSFAGIQASDLGEQLEESMVQLIGSIPSCMSELESVDKTIHHLQSELRTLGDQLEVVGARTSSEVGQLIVLQRLKGHFELCAATLVEAANWSLLLREANGTD